MVHWGMTRRVTLKTPLDPQEVRGRLRAAVDPPWALFGSRPARGTVGQWTAGLSLRQRLVHNTFQTRLGLVMEPEDERAGRGVILHGAFGIGLFARIALIFMAAAVMVATLGVLETQGPDSIVPWIVAGVGVMAVGVVYGVGRAVARGQEDDLIRFVTRTLDARVIETPRDD